MKRQVKKFERRLNTDTASAEKIQQTNERLFQYLQEKGEKDAAKQLQYLMHNQAKPEHEDAKKNPAFDKLLITNDKILAILTKLEREAIDEQDTSIKSVEKAQKEVAKPVLTKIPVAANDEAANDEGSGLSFGLDDLPDRRSKKTKTPEKGTGKGTEKAKTGKQKVPGKPKKVSKIPGAGKATGKLGKKLGTKVGARMAGKLLGGALKFAGPIGAIITAGMAAMDAKEGWDNAGDTFGLQKGEEATTGQKASSAAGSAISGLTFGLADAKETSKGVNNLFGGNDTIKKYEKEGIIEHHTFGNSAVKDWVGLSRLPSKEIQKIIDIDDWSVEDLTRLKSLQTERNKAETAPNIAPSSKQFNGPQTNGVAASNMTATGTNFAESTATAAKGAGAGRGMGSAALAVGSVPPISGDDEVKAMIKRHEGVRNKPYKDSLGLWTVGVGHLIGDGKSLPPDMDRVFSDDEVNTLFEEDYAVHKKAAEQIPGFNDLNATGQGALTDLTFNMGGKWYKRWPKFTKSISEGDTETAAKSLEDSKWYSQVGNRAPEIVAMVRAGDSDSPGLPGTTGAAAGSTTATTSKNTGSGVTPQKTSEVKVATADTKKSEPASETPVESSKDKKESVANQTNQALAANTVAYDTGTQSKAMSTIIPVINQNINSTKPQENVGQDRLLNLFS